MSELKQHLILEHYFGINENGVEQKENMINLALEYYNTLKSYYMCLSNHGEEFLEIQDDLIRISHQFTKMKEYYRPIYLTEKIEKENSNLKLYTTEIFSKKKLVLSTNRDDKKTNQQERFIVCECKKDIPEKLGEAKFQLQEEPDFSITPEIWVNQNTTTFTKEEGEIITENYLFPKQLTLKK